ncbi:MAG: pyruvate kinase [Candidatus Nomurabacteria bacterium]|jgi:pyruvate kinase|nr:pyruvate kinase [Candidatus Nomurabacteria bacterium]
MSKIFKRTKILATIGPAVNSFDAIYDLIDAGVNGCRLNFSHGNYEEREQQLKWIREASEKRKKNVAIIQDLQGPKIRLGELKDNHLLVKKDDELILDYMAKEHDGGMTLPVQYNLAEKVKVGDPVFIFDGKIKTKVIEIVSDTAIKLLVENDGFLMSKKGLNLPDTDFGGDIITEKDMRDIEWGVGKDFDFVALSFIQSVADIDNLRQILVSLGSNAQIIAKIETKKAIEDDEAMRAIVTSTDAIMVARGDMAVEAGAEVVPVVQRKLVEFCREQGKLCIVATQTMGSMVENPEPTRAEVNDVATAVIQGADVVMLSDETANGKYPIETVREMKKIILYTQNHIGVDKIDLVKHEQVDIVAHSAVRLAEKIEADLIVTETGSGLTATSVASHRPSMPIISVTSHQRVAQQLALMYANSAFVRAYTETYGLDLVKELKETGYLQGENLKVVIVSGHERKVGGADTIRLRII